MKNLRRILSMVLAVCMMLTMSVTFASADAYYEYDDVKVGDKYAEAITLLSGLGIVNGYEDNKFHPELYITRAEAATMIVRTLGMDENVIQGDTIFSDVDASHWASGYINIAVENGIINGFPEGTFLPQDNVTYEQIVKMVVCAIGHDPKANELGGYPQGFIRAASDAKVTKGISGLGSNAAPRGLVAQLIYNALEVEMMDATSYSTGILGTSYAYNGRTILRDYLEIEKVDAVVIDTYLTGETFSSRDKFVELEITEVYGLADRVSRPLYDEGDVVEFDEGSFEAASNYLGRAITAYVGEDEDTRNDTIFAITIDDARNDEVEVTKDRFFAEDSDETVISYTKRVTDKRLTELDLDKNVTVVVNGGIVSDSITKYFDEFDVMTLVDNNSDNEYDFIFVDVFDETEGVEFVVEEIEEDDEFYYFEGDNGELELDLEDDEVLIKIIKDGYEVGPEDIEIGDTVTCLDTSRSIITVYVSGESVKGIIDEVDYIEGEYYIDEEAYELSPAFAEDLSAGDYGTFYLNYQGKIAYSTVASRVADGDYIFITNYGTETKFSKTTYLIQVITEKGEVETYTLKSSKMKYVDDRGNMYKNVTPKVVYDYLTFHTTDLSTAYGVNGYVGLARVKASSAGVISEIYIPGTYEEFYEQTKYASENSKEYSAKRETYGTYDITGKEVAFRIDDSEEELTDAVATGTTSEFFTDGNSYSFLAYGERGEDIEVVVITDGIATADYQNHAVLVTKVSTVRVGDETSTKIAGLQNGNNVIYIVDPDEDYDVEVGNIVLVSENASGYVTKLEKVANTTEDMDDLYTAFAGVDVPSDEDAGVFGGMAEDKTSKRFVIENIEEPFYDEDNTVYYLIDYTSRETIFEKGSLSSIKVSGSTASYVIVRTYEEEAVDVFVFRLDADDDIDVPTTDIWDNIQAADPEEPETEAPTQAPTQEETAPTEAPTDAPTAEPTDAPTDAPTAAPTDAPTAAPTAAPTDAPTDAPTAAPTDAPTAAPTDAPTAAPTDAPTAAPTDAPTAAPTAAPTDAPTAAPTDAPTAAPTDAPTAAPTDAPTAAPTDAPTAAPTDAPTAAPTDAPTAAPTDAPTAAPTDAPTAAPTAAPTDAPTENTADPTDAPTAPPTDAPTQDGPILAEIPTEAATAKKVTVDAKVAEEVLKLINAERAKNNLPALTWDKAVAAVAEAHCVDMATNNYLDQKNKAGADIAKRLTDAKVVFTKAAENLAKGKYTPQVIVDAWMKSEKHKVNILSSEFTKVGISVATAIDGTVYWTVDFVK